MRRTIILLIALFLPMLAYWFWFQVEQRRGMLKDAMKPWWVIAPWPKLVAASVVLLITALLGLTLLDSSSRDGLYHPAQMIDGHIVPGRMEPEAK